MYSHGCFVKERKKCQSFHFGILVLILPRSAAPISRTEFRAGILTMMSRPEAFSISGNMFLNDHIRIAKANKLYLVTFFRQDSRLLRSARRAFRFVISRKLFSSIFHNYSFGKAYQPSGIMILFFERIIWPFESRTQTLAFTLSANITGCPFGT